jgi:hypothetical protein
MASRALVSHSGECSSMVRSRAMLGHDKAHKVQSVKSNFMLRGLQKMTIHRKADGLRCWHFWDGPWKVGRFFEFALL